MSDIAILKEMIKETATVALEERQEGKRLKYSVTLEEKDIYSVTIDGMPKYDEVIIIKADTFVAPRDIFNGSKGECKRADFVIITDTDKEKIILCIEMKKTKGEKKAIIKQLTGAQCFVAYCKEIGKAFWHKQNFLDTYKYSFVSIGHISLDKKKTRPERSTDTHNSPDLMLRINYSHPLQFNHLI
ncbi:hypothetical protein [Argonema galeatum]|uniref:hypothetical protein n=1 Tax=Argonema galeatum TaxID=2942762 RepID=UPI002011709B|nr:hypothetical protein [Argonema galeatum]MCL1467035.1 hypothetical protein [Argonema galeatum A003/A1]